MTFVSSRFPQANKKQEAQQCTMSVEIILLLQNNPPKNPFEKACNRLLTRKSLNVIEITAIQ